MSRPEPARPVSLALGVEAVKGKSTLNRLELSRETPTKYRKIAHEPTTIEALFVDLFLEAHDRPPQQIILDLDATDDPLHGHQEGRFFHGYYLRPTSAGGQAQAVKHRRQRRLG